MHDRFTDDVKTIVELEDEIRLSNLRGAKIADRMRELHYRYQSLERLWPIVPGRGMRRRFTVGEDIPD